MDNLKNFDGPYHIQTCLKKNQKQILFSNHKSITFSGLFDGDHTTIYASLYFLMEIERSFKFIAFENTGKTNTFSSAKPDQKIIQFNKLYGMTREIAICTSNEVNLTFYVKEITSSKNSTGEETNRFLKNTDTLAEDYGALVEEEESKDVVFIVESEKISAHKFILTTRSPVFKRMFQVDMLEKNSAKPIKINDASKEVFKEFLTFLYCNRYTDKPNLDRELLYLADKYDVKGLKAAAANELLKKMDVNNAIDTMVLFERHRVPKLNTEVAKFIAKNKKEIGDSKLEALRVTHSSLCDLIEMAENAK